MPLRKSFLAMLKLTRIEHSIMLVVAVAASELIAGGGSLPGLFVLLMSFATPVLVSMGSFAINDYFDVEVDRANGKGDRPLVSKQISMRGALAVALGSFVVGVLASLFINMYAFAIALIFAMLAMLYSYRLKEMLLLGNAYVAFSMAIPFIYGNYVVAGTISPVIAVLSATVLASGFAREIHGTIRDYDGDRKVRNVKSLPHYAGMLGAAAIAALFYAAAVALSVILFFLAPPFRGNLFYISAIAVVDALLAYVSAAYFKRRGRSRMFKTTRDLSLAAMGLALLIYLIAAIA